MKQEMATRCIPIIKTDNDLRLITGIVYEPDTVDTDGDFAETDSIREAAHEFLASYRTVKVMHKDEAPDIDVVESYLAPTRFSLDGLQIKKGTWVVLLKIHNDAIWHRVKQGELTGLSMGGVAERVPV